MSLASLSAVARRHRHQRRHEFKRSLRRFCHLVFQFPRGVAREAEQLGALRADLRQTRERTARIVLIAVLRAFPGVAENLFARRAHA